MGSNNNSNNNNWVLSSGVKSTKNISGDDIFKLLDNMEKLTLSIKDDVNMIYEKNVIKQQQQQLNENLNKNINLNEELDNKQQFNSVDNTITNNL